MKKHFIPVYIYRPQAIGQLLELRLAAILGFRQNDSGGQALGMHRFQRTTPGHRVNTKIGPWEQIRQSGKSASRYISLGENSIQPLGQRFCPTFGAVQNKIVIPSLINS